MNGSDLKAMALRCGFGGDMDDVKLFAIDSDWDRLAECLEQETHFGGDQWTPEQIAKIAAKERRWLAAGGLEPCGVREPKGPRPYHTGRFVPLIDPKIVAQDGMCKLRLMGFNRLPPNPALVSMDYGDPRGDRALEVVASVGPDGIVVHDVIEHVCGDAGCGHDSDCAVHNEPAMPAGPCNCRRFFEIEAPNSVTGGQDFAVVDEVSEWPKKPIDFSAITVALSAR